MCINNKVNFKISKRDIYQREREKLKEKTDFKIFEFDTTSALNIFIIEE